ncbi:MAG: transposase [Candidatus Contendobacter sp.]|nr:transposase [Candidatus Contendobacter sp.]
MKGARERGTLENEKTPIFGMIQRGGAVVVRMLENVQQTTIRPLIERFIAPGSRVYIDEYDIYHRLPEWGFNTISL